MSKWKHKITIINYIYIMQAFTNPSNSGLGASGRDVNSGWNCVATKNLCFSNSQICIMFSFSFVQKSTEIQGHRESHLYKNVWNQDRWVLIHCSCWVFIWWFISVQRLQRLHQGLEVDRSRKAFEIFLASGLSENSNHKYNIMSFKSVYNEHGAKYMSTYT